MARKKRSMEEIQRRIERRTEKVKARNLMEAKKREHITAPYIRMLETSARHTQEACGSDIGDINVRTFQHGRRGKKTVYAINSKRFGDYHFDTPREGDRFLDGLRLGCIVSKKPKK